MEEKVFMEESIEPTDQIMLKVLGNEYSHYQKIIKLVKLFSKEWAFSKKGRWMLKIHDKKKTFFYIIPLKEEIKIGMTIRENEKNILVADKKLKEIKGIIESAKKFSEGFAIYFYIRNEKEFRIFEMFIEKLISVRI